MTRLHGKPYLSYQGNYHILVTCMVCFHWQNLSTRLKIKVTLHKTHKIILLELKGEKNILQFSQRKEDFYNELCSYRSQVLFQFQMPRYPRNAPVS